MSWYISGIRLQTVDDAQENASWYGEPASEPRIYAYVQNDPLNNTDPSGNCPACWGAAIGFGVDLGAQLLFTGTYDWRQGLAATAAGALTRRVSAHSSAERLRQVGGRVIANSVVGAAVGGTQAEGLNLAIGQQNNVGGAAILGGFGWRGRIVCG